MFIPTEAWRVPDEEAPGRPTEATPLLAALPRRGQSSRVSDEEAQGSSASLTVTGCYEKLFMPSRNPRFARHLEMAVRAGLLIAAFSCIHRHMPKGKAFGIFHLNQKLGLILLQFVFTLMPSVGPTVYAAKAGMLGTCLGFLMGWLMFGLLPCGVFDEAASRAFVLLPPATMPPEAGCKEWIYPTWIVGVVAGSMFIMTVLLLNLDNTTKVFALSTFVWHWMAFMTPTRPEGYSTGFRIEIDGPMVSGAMAAAVGSLLAVVVVCLPYPYTALNDARVCARDVVEHTGSAWETAIRYYCPVDDPPSLQDRVSLQASLRAMRHELLLLRGHIDMAWYECFGYGRGERTRQMLMRLEVWSKERCDILTSVVALCLHEQWEEGHDAILRPCVPTIKRLGRMTHELIRHAVGVICTGEWIDEETARELHALEDELERELHRFHQAFAESKLAMGNTNAFDAELMEELAFCRALSRYGASTIKFSKLLRCPAKDEFDVAVATSGGGVFDTAIIFDRDNLIFTVHHAISIFLCFWIGHRGYSTLLPRFNANIASTCAVLTSKFVGSAVTRNLDRLQGVVIGLVTSELLYALFGWCSLWARVTMTLVLFLFVTFGEFFYFDSKRYGNVTLLMLAFGGAPFFHECSSKTADLLDAKAIAHAVIDVVICVFLMLAVESNFGVDNASTKAHRSMEQLWASIREGFTNLLDPDRVEIHFLRDEILTQIAAAQAMGSEAGQELRLWRTDWKDGLYNHLLRVAKEVVSGLSNMDHCFTEEGATDKMREQIPGSSNRPRTRPKMYDELVRMDFFSMARTSIMRRLDLIDCFVAMLAVEDNSIVSLAVGDILVNHSAMTHMFAEAARNACSVDEDAKASCIHQEKAAKLSMFWICFLSVQGSLDSIENAEFH